jgi:hypothetical protein
MIRTNYTGMVNSSKQADYYGTDVGESGSYNVKFRDRAGPYGWVVIPLMVDFANRGRKPCSLCPPNAMVSIQT